MKKISNNQNGFSYFVSAKQLALYAKLTDLEKLQWVDDARTFTLIGQTAETKARHESLRKGHAQK
ncbi:MAG: hypothetical protein H7Z18_00465 [Methylophilaceae bacterium]|nr:hypothetical protein [Methylophilaceae bacterium]